MTRALALVRGCRDFVAALGGVCLTLVGIFFVFPDGLLQTLEGWLEKRIRMRGHWERQRTLKFQTWSMRDQAQRLGAKGPEEVRAYLIYRRLQARTSTKNALHDLPDEWWADLEREVLGSA